MLSLIAVYIAVGSGLPSLREYFEKDELSFFNTWLFKLLMVLMVTTLATVTFERIPFKPTRFGAWIVHVGIVTLIGGGYWYYFNKTEGAVLIPLQQTAQVYFDRWERALYVQTNGKLARTSLPNLPRFNSYDESLGNAGYLSKVKNLKPISTSDQAMTVAEMAGVKDLRFDIVGYYRYASVRKDLADVPNGRPGFKFSGPAAGDEPRDLVLTTGDMQFSRLQLGEVEIILRHLKDEAELQSLIQSAGKIHSLKVQVAGVVQDLNVEVGNDYALGNTGYSIHIESFDPRWQTMDKQVVPLLTMMVKSPTTSFRRQVISGVDKPTDWLLGAEGSGPLGKRQTTPLDQALSITYTYDSSSMLHPGEAFVRHTFCTVPGSTKTIVFSAGQNIPVETETTESSTGSIAIKTAFPPSAVMMAAASGKPLPKQEAVSLAWVRKESASTKEYVEEVPVQQRNKEEDTSGRKQVARVRVSNNDGWSQDVLVPFNEHILLSAWQGGTVNVPGAGSPIQIQLGNNFKPLPASIRLDKFEAESYGGLEISAAPMMRDFKSTITITDRRTGERVTDTVFLNSPVFYDSGNWIFFQSGWDNEKQQFSILGIANRPGVWAMLIGCILIVLGVFYAFYIKPILINYNKKQALEQARAKGLM